MFRIQVAWSKMPKGGVGTSGDSVELVERPLGGVTLILADGQGSGPAARRISRLVSMKAVSLIADGSRDGAVARAVQDMLYTAREGRVTATLALLTVDFATRSLVISRNSPAPVVVRQEDRVFRIDGAAEVIGTYRRTKPQVTELDLVEGTICLTWAAWDTRLAASDVDQLADLVDALMQDAVDLDQGRPGDDISIMALGVRRDDQSSLRRLSASIPF
jgi:hypothetical protein